MTGRRNDPISNIFTAEARLFVAEAGNLTSGLGDLTAYFHDSRNGRDACSRVIETICNHAPGARTSAQIEKWPDGRRLVLRATLPQHVAISIRESLIDMRQGSFGCVVHCRECRSPPAPRAYGPLRTLKQYLTSLGRIAL